MNLKETIQNEICFHKNEKYNISSRKMNNIDDDLLTLIIESTKYLDNLNPKTSDRIKYILNDKSEPNKCKLCGKKILSLRYKFCSYACNNNSDETKNKFRDAYNKLTILEKEKRNQQRKKTDNEKYGGIGAQSKIISEKIKKKMILLYGVDSPFKMIDFNERCVKTWIKKYGVDNPFKSDEIKKKIKLKLFEKYGVDNPAQINSSNRMRKIMKTKTERGLIVSDLFLSDYKCYVRKARKLTEINYKKHKTHINPNDYKRVTCGNDGYQLDHKYTVLEGFLDDVDVNIISHPCNLQMLNWKDNSKKRSKSSINIDDLLIEIENHNKIY